MRTHPEIVFRDGPSGRRAGLVAGPDVWEIAALIRELPGSAAERVAHAATQLGLTLLQARAASSYYAEFRDEIDAEIEQNRDAAELEFAAWANECRLLSDEWRESSR